MEETVTLLLIHSAEDWRNLVPGIGKSGMKFILDFYHQTIC